MLSVVETVPLVLLLLLVVFVVQGQVYEVRVVLVEVGWVELDGSGLAFGLTVLLVDVDGVALLVLSVQEKVGQVIQLLLVGLMDQVLELVSLVPFLELDSELLLDLLVLQVLLVLALLVAFSSLASWPSSWRAW